MKKAFTLIEYIVAIGIIGILTAATVIGLGSFAPSFKVNGVSHNLVSHLRQAQEEAVTIQKPHAIRFNLASNPPTYELIKIEDSETVVRSYRLPENLEVTLDPSISESQIIFSADGGPSSAGNITLTIEGKSKIVNISPAGVIKLQ